MSEFEKSYLDSEGLSTFWGKIKDNFLTGSASLSYVDSWKSQARANLGITLGTSAGNVPQLDSNGKLLLSIFPDAIMGQLLFGGTVIQSGCVIATLTDNIKAKLGISTSTVVLTNDTGTYGYEKFEGVYFIALANFTFASLDFETGDWLISIGPAWKKVDNTDAVTSVAGKTGAVTLNGNDISVANSTNGHLAALDASGHIVDSGKNPADFATTTQGGYADGAIQKVKIGSAEISKSGAAGAKEVTLPYADEDTEGVVSASAQTFNGDKTFNGNIHGMKGVSAKGIGDLTEYGGGGGQGTVQSLKFGNNTPYIPVDGMITVPASAFVPSVGGASGPVTVRGGQSENGDVNLVVVNGQLQASVVGLEDGAFKHLDIDVTSDSFSIEVGGDTVNFGTITSAEINALGF